MNLIFPDASLVPLLQRVANGDLKYGLFDNDVTPGPGTVLSDLNEWSHADGYGSKILVPSANFTLTGVTGHKGSITAPDISWTFTGGPWNLYGYFIVDTTEGIFLAAARFDGAPLVVNAGTVIVVTPKLGDFSEYTA